MKLMRNRRKCGRYTPRQFRIAARILDKCNSETYKYLSTIMALPTLVSISRFRRQTQKGPSYNLTDTYSKPTDRYVPVQFPSFPSDSES